MIAKANVIYCRFSTEMQRVDSNVDQERRCRDALQRMGFDGANFRVITDEAISGTCESRPGFDQVKELLYSGRLGILIVSEQSRLSRGDNAKSLIKDIVFHGGRFITVSEGVDTGKPNWKLIVGINEIHHARSNDDTAERVRGGQEGRVLDGCGSAGDFPYGYTSEYVDPESARTYQGRGPKPKKKVVIDPAASAVVKEVFSRFTDMNQSISQIVKWLNSIRDTIPTIGKGNWHHQIVRRMLDNAKYIGDWKYGATTTVRNSEGVKRQVEARPDQRVIRVARPALRIIDQPTWEAVQAKLAHLKEIYGMRPSGKRRGPTEHYRNLYARSLLYGKVRCAVCGGTFIHVGSSGVSMIGCGNHPRGQCPVSARLPVNEAEAKLFKILQAALVNVPEWLEKTRDQMNQALRAELERVPDALGQTQNELRDTERKIDNLVKFLEKGNTSEAIEQKLQSLEAEKNRLTEGLSELQHLPATGNNLPNDEWMLREFQSLSTLLANRNTGAISICRNMFGQITAEEVKAPGKVRGYIRLRIQLQSQAIIDAVLRDHLPAHLLAKLKVTSSTEGAPEIVIDFGRPTKMDEWAPQIVEWRRNNVPWKEIAQRTGLKMANAYTAYRRYIESTKAA